MSEVNTNELALAGKLINKEFAFDIDKNHGRKETFYRLTLEIPRLSETMDSIPIIVSERYLAKSKAELGSYVGITGEIRTTRRDDPVFGKNKLVVYGLAQEVIDLTEEDFAYVDDKNSIKVEGYICNTPTLRETVTGRIISDLTVAINGRRGAGSFVPCVAWGSNAKLAKKLPKGTKIHLHGRFQSRKYRKFIDGEEIVRTAYEVSIVDLWTVDENADEIDVVEEQIA